MPVWGTAGSGLQASGRPLRRPGSSSLEPVLFGPVGGRATVRQDRVRGQERGWSMIPWRSFRVVSWLRCSLLGKYGVTPGSSLARVGSKRWSLLLRFAPTEPWCCAPSVKRPGSRPWSPLSGRLPPWTPRSTTTYGRCVPGPAGRYNGDRSFPPCIARLGGTEPVELMDASSASFGGAGAPGDVGAVREVAQRGTQRRRHTHMRELRTGQFSVLAWASPDRRETSCGSVER